jgi:hypothetical protein
MYQRKPIARTSISTEIFIWTQGKKGTHQNETGFLQRPLSACCLQSILPIFVIHENCTSYYNYSSNFNNYCANRRAQQKTRNDCATQPKNHAQEIMIQAKIKLPLAAFVISAKVF